MESDAFEYKKILCAGHELKVLDHERACRGKLYWNQKEIICMNAL
jgi:hypothetical protein